MQVDFAFCETGERCVGLLLLRKRRVEKHHGLVIAELPCPALECAVTRDLVMLDGLRGCEKPAMEWGHVLVLVHDLLPLVENAHDGIAVFALRSLANRLEALLKPLHLLLG